VSTAQVIDLARDARAEGLINARDCLDLQEGSRKLEKVAKDLRLAVGMDSGRFASGQLLEKPDFAPALAALIGEVEALARSWKRRPSVLKGWKNAGSARSS
jgi:ATP-dependent DNA helicase DinG